MLRRLPRPTIRRSTRSNTVRIPVRRLLRRSERLISKRNVTNTKAAT